MTPRKVRWKAAPVNRNIVAASLLVTTSVPLFAGGQRASAGERGRRSRNRGNHPRERHHRLRATMGVVTSNSHMSNNFVHRHFHPAVAAWFTRRFPAGPTVPQTCAWPPILEGRSTLVAAPTGSGKTLAAFLAAIDGLVREA